MAVALENPKKRKDDAPLPPIPTSPGARQTGARAKNAPPQGIAARLKYNSAFLKSIPGYHALAPNIDQSAGQSPNTSLIMPPAVQSANLDPVAPQPRPETYLPASTPDRQVQTINDLGLNPGAQRLRVDDPSPPSLVMPDLRGGTGGSTAPSAAPTAASASEAQNNLTSYGGRIINGVPTFSDGSNGVPRTVSAAQMQSAAQNLSRADAGALANPLASDTRGGRTPTVDEMVSQRVANTPTPPQLVNPALQQMFADSDAASVASGDWRSPLGTAASNLRVEANSGTPRNRRIAENRLTNLTRGVQARAETTANNTARTAQTGIQERGATQRTGMQQRGANARTSAQERGASARTAAQLNQPVQVMLPGGGMGLMNPRNGAVRAIEYQNQPVSSAKMTPQQKHTQDLVDALRASASKALEARMKNQLPGEDGTVASPTPDVMRQILANQAYVQGYSPQINPKTGQMVITVNGQKVLL